MPETAGVQPFPFDLPPDLLARLGYERACAPFEITGALRDQLRRQYGAEGLTAFDASIAARGARRWGALFWEPAGDELGWTDHWPCLDLVHRPQVRGWLVEHAVDLGSSEAPATHALVVDRDTGQAWIAPIATRPPAIGRGRSRGRL